jgi:hypothetical protein
MSEEKNNGVVTEDTSSEIGESVAEQPTIEQTSNKSEVRVEVVQVKSDDVPGQGAATASLVLGIISVVCWFFGWSSVVSVILGIIGLVMASKSKKAGFTGGIRTAGFVLSLIGLVGGAIVLVACVACVGLLGAASVAG